MTNMPFVKMLTELRGGEIEALASEKMREMLAAIAEHGGKGTLAVSFEVSRTEHGHIEVKPKVKMTKPEPAMRKGIFWMTEDGELTRRDPNQADIEDLPGVKRPPRTIEGALRVAP